MEDEISLKDLLILFLKNAKQILVGTLIFALVIGGFGLYKGLKEYKAVLSEGNQSYQDEAIKHEEEIKAIEKSIESAKNRKADIMEYTENSIYYNINSFQKAVKEIVFYIETEGQDLDKIDNIATAYSNTYKSNDFYKGIQEILEKEISPKYINEILSVTKINETDVIKIEASHQEQLKADQMADYTFKTLQEKITRTMGNHRVIIMTEASYLTIDENLKALQDKHMADIQSIDEHIKNEIIELDKAELNTPNIVSSSISDVIKQGFIYGVIGSILGVMMLCMWILMIKFTNNIIRTKHDVTENFNIDVLGSLPSQDKQDKRKMNIFNKLIRALEGPDIYDLDYVESLKLMAADIKAKSHHQITNKVIFTGSGDLKDIRHIANKMLELLEIEDPNLQVSYGASVLTSHGTVEALSNDVEVVLVEKRGASYINVVKEQVTKLEKSGKKDIGYNFGLGYIISIFNLFEFPGTLDVERESKLILKQYVATDKPKLSF